MPNNGTYAICPYYETEERYIIKCEGMVDVSRINIKNYMRFNKKISKDAWVKCYCESHKYHECPYANVLDRKYMDQERERTNVKNNSAKIIIRN